MVSRGEFGGCDRSVESTDLLLEGLGGVEDWRLVGKKLSNWEGKGKGMKALVMELCWGVNECIDKMSEWMRVCEREIDIVSWGFKCEVASW